LAELKAIFDEEAAKNHVYPLDDRGTGRLLTPKPTPADPARKVFTYFSGATRLAENAAPNTKNKSHTITADIVMPDKDGSGVIVAEGGASAGFSLFVKDGKLVYEYNWFDEDRTVITSTEAVPAGKSTVSFDFTYDGGGPGLGGNGRLLIDGKEVGAGRIERTVASRFGIDTFGVGMDTGSPVSKGYRPPYSFDGTVEKVVIELK
jgi:arylsulfatase